MEDNQDYKIEIKSLYKIFGKSKNIKYAYDSNVSKEELLKTHKLTCAIRDVNLSVKKGEILVLMGLSGCGKSTFARCLNMLIPPTSGSIIVDSKDITKFSKKELIEYRRNKISMVFQSFGLFPHINIRDNVRYGLDVKGIPKSEGNRIVNEILTKVDLINYANSKPSELSGGMKQRVGLARALATGSDILLMDEAFSALDPLIRSSMQDELLNIQEEIKKTIVFITHDLDEALKIGDRIAIMKDGEIVQIDSPSKILSNPKTDFVRNFTGNVDLTKTLTAKDVLKSVNLVAYPTESATICMLKMKESGLSTLFVCKKNRELLGYITDTMLEKQVGVEKQVGTVDSIGAYDDVLNLVVMYEKVQRVVHLDTPIKDLFGYFSNSHEPVAVVDNKNILKGVIVRGSIISALAQSKQ